MADIQVKAPDGRLGTIPSENLQIAIKQGYQPLSQAEIEHQSALDEAGSGLGPLKAFGESAASALTFGGSREATNALGITTPESQALTKEANPGWSGIGTAAGIAAPIVATLGAATPEALAAGATETGLQTAGRLAPLSQLSRAGTAVSEAVAPTLGKYGAAIAGGAVEGAGFGVGQAIDEHAMGDPEALGEHLLSTVGLNALVGGGIGAIFAPFAKAYEAATPTAADVLADSPAPTIPTEVPIGRPINTFEDAIKYSTADNPETKKTILDGLTQLKGHASEIKSAADHLGVPTFAGQVSDSGATQKAWEILSESPSPIGVAEAQKVDDAYKTVQSRVEQAIHSDTNASAAEVGQSIKDSLLGKANSMIESYSQKFNELGLTEKAIPVNERSLNAITKNIQKIPEVRGNIAPAFAQQMEGRLATVQTLQDLKTQIKALNSDIYSFNIGANEKRIASTIKEKLQNLYENTIRKQFSKADQKELFALYKGANKEFAESLNTLSDISGAVGKSRIKSPIDFVNYLSDKTNADTLVNKLFKKNDAEGMASFQKNFPEEWNMVKGYQRSQIGEYKDGVLNLNGALKKIGKMEPELKNAVFNPDEIKTLESAKTWTEAFPKTFRTGSKTAPSLGWMNYLKNPIEAAYTHVRDVGLKAGLSGIEESTGNTAKVGMLQKIQSAADKTKNAIDYGAKAIFSDKGQAAAIGAASMIPDDKEINKVIDHVDQMNANPEEMMNALHNNTKDLYNVAPATSAGVQKSIVAATSFLSSKVPRASIQVKSLSNPYKPSKSELYKFGGYIHTIKQPTSVLKGIRHGMVTPDQMETLKAVYPQMLQQMQMAVINNLTDHMSKEKELPYSTKLGLSAFLETNLTNSLEQQSIAMNQYGPMSSPSSGDQMKATQKGLQSLKESDRVKGSLEKIDDNEA